MQPEERVQPEESVWSVRRAFVRQLAKDELGELRMRRSLGLAITRLLPEFVGNRARTALLRAAGISIGPGSAIGGRLWVSGDDRVTIGADCWINTSCRFDVSAPVTIGDGVAIGHEVLILTNSHEIGPTSSRAGSLRNLPVVVGDGCWLGARVVVLPGVTIGAGSIVAAGAVVVDDVPANALVAGVPATAVRSLEPDSDPGVVHLVG